MYETYFFVSSGFYSATVNLQPNYTLTVYIPASSSLLHELTSPLLQSRLSARNSAKLSNEELQAKHKPAH
jgi:hypothetical protein